jgi:serine/threonine protein kinase
MTSLVEDKIFIHRGRSVRAAKNWYKVLHFLGRGGNGTVYLVQATSGEIDGAIFALKVFHRMSSEPRLKRFLAEIAFLRDSNHPHWMRHLDEGEFEARPFVVQDYMPRTLAAEQENGGVDFGRALVFSCQLVSALNTLHSKGVIHRDIKPRNIFIEGISSYLGDFGLIKKLVPEPDSEDLRDFKGYFCMPRFYRTPELVGYAKQECKLDLRSDIFQLGLVMTEMFTGQNVHKRPTDFLNPIELHELPQVPGKHGALIAVVLRGMLELDPERRFTLTDVQSRLKTVVENYGDDFEKLHGRYFIG